MSRGDQSTLYTVECNEPICVEEIKGCKHVFQNEFAGVCVNLLWCISDL